MDGVSIDAGISNSPSYLLCYFFDIEVVLRSFFEKKIIKRYQNNNKNKKQNGCPN